MKKLSLVLVTVIAVFSLAACGWNKEKKTEDTNSISAKVEKEIEKGSSVLEDVKDTVGDAVETEKSKTCEVIEKGNEKAGEDKAKASKAIEGVSKELDSSVT